MLMLFSKWVMANETAETPQANASELVDKIVAIVDDDIIMLSELDERVISIKNRLSRQGTSLPSDRVVKQRVLEQLIIEDIQLQLANRAGIRVPDEQLNETLSILSEQISQQESALEEAQSKVRRLKKTVGLIGRDSLIIATMNSEASEERTRAIALFNEAITFTLVSNQKSNPAIQSAIEQMYPKS